MRIFLIIVGIVLLLPGECGAIFTVIALGNSETAGVLLISLPSLALGVIGIFIIRHAIRRQA